MRIELSHIISFSFGIFGLIITIISLRIMYNQIQISKKIEIFKIHKEFWDSIRWYIMHFTSVYNKIFWYVADKETNSIKYNELAKFLKNKNKGINFLNDLINHIKQSKNFIKPSDIKNEEDKKIRFYQMHFLTSITTPSFIWKKFNNIHQSYKNLFEYSMKTSHKYVRLIKIEIGILVFNSYTQSFNESLKRFIYR